MKDFAFHVGMVILLYSFIIIIGYILAGLITDFEFIGGPLLWIIQ